MKLSAIVEQLEGVGVTVRVVGSASNPLEISQIASLQAAQSENISFLSDAKRLSELASTQAGVVILKEEHADLAPCLALVVADPYYAYAKVAQLLNPLPTLNPGTHPSAYVSDDAQLETGVEVKAQAFVGRHAQLGAETVVSEGAVVQNDVVVGARCRIGPNVVIMQACQIGDDTTIEAGTIIGGDGFGWANLKGRWEKVPQIGRVIVGNNVSIGNNCTIDRGALEDTVIADGCIIDNQVHIAHNVKIGEGSAIAGQVGFAGSTTIGKHCTVAGQVGFAGHLEVGDQVHLLAKAGVTHSIKKPGAYAGFPAMDVATWQKNNVRAKHLDKMARQIKSLQKQIDQLTQAASED